MEVRYSIWGVANRLKREDVGEMKHSPFRDVYRKANAVLSDIVERAGVTDNGSTRDEQVANTISFLGERGRGKTSAMLSFYLYLNKLQTEDAETVYFYKIPYIDAAMLAENEFLIDVVLAKMWDEFDRHLKSPSNIVRDAKFEIQVKRVKEKFVEARQAYLVLKGKESKGRETDMREIPAASALHELAASLNLKEKMEELVKEYIEVMSYNSGSVNGKGYLVVAIDDVDMANASAQAVLEQIRRFLSVPQVIILMTADFERLKMVCGAFYKTKMLQMSEGNPQKFVVDYLEKVLPTNMRIYLPELSENSQEVIIDNNKSFSSKYHLKSKSEKEIILEIIAKKCGIYFDVYRGRRSFWQNDSLRSLVNYFAQMENLDKEENFDVWLKKDLQERIIERVESERQKRFLRKILKQDDNQINQRILDYIRYELREREILSVYEKSMGQLLYALYSLERENLAYADFVNSIIAFYSLVMRQARLEEKRKMIGDCLWGEWEYGLFSSAQMTSNITAFANKAELSFEVTEEIKTYIEEKKLDDAVQAFLKNHDADISAWLLCMLYANIKIPASRIFTFSVDTEGPFFLSEEEKDKFPPAEMEQRSFFKLQPQLFAVKCFFKFLYLDVEEQKTLCRELLKCAIDALREKMASVMGCKAKKKSYTEYIQKKIKWLEALGLQDCVSEELLQSVEILYSIGPELGREKEASISDTEKLVERTAAVYQKVQKELQLRDDFYKEKLKLGGGFAQCIENSLQAKVLQGRVELSEELRAAFEERFTMLFKPPAAIRPTK